MVTIVIGGSSSGKSEYAESLLDHFQGHKYYLATLSAQDDESLERIRKHRERRAGRAFETMECPVDLELACIDVPEGSAVLLECIGNLAANEFFRYYSPQDWDAYEEAGCAKQRILGGVKVLSERAEELVIVSNEVNRAGCDYKGDTLLYQKLIGELNQALCHAADRVVEMVCGIPVDRKLL